MRIARFLGLTVLMTLVLAAACGDDDDDGDDAGEPTASQEEQSSPTAATGGGEATAVVVSLGEWFVEADPASAPAGTVTFDVTNASTQARVPHQLVVMRTDLPLDDLPVDRNGAVDEAAEGVEVAGVIPLLSPGQSKELIVDLEAGTYGLVCNIYVAEATTAHYQKGMVTEFIVE